MNKITFDASGKNKFVFDLFLFLKSFASSLLSRGVRIITDSYSLSCKNPSVIYNVNYKVYMQECYMSKQLVSVNR